MTDKHEQRRDKLRLVSSYGEDEPDDDLGRQTIKNTEAFLRGKIGLAEYEINADCIALAYFMRNIAKKKRAN